MHLTVAICTWNRAAMLQGALESLEGLRVPAGIEWSVLVVDNGSTDSTAAVVASFEGCLPIRRVEEGRRGLSHARNCATDHAMGECILWIDDDVVVEPDWLAAYAEAFGEWPNAAVFGGPIIPRLEGNPPEWLVRALPYVANAFSGRDLGDRPVRVGPSPDRFPYGANLAIRTEVQREFRFPPERGRRGRALGLGGEETVVIDRILDSGREGRWVPGAVVHHRIGEDRQTTRFLRRYAVADGRSDALGSDEVGEGLFALEALPSLGRALLSELRFRIRQWTAPPETWVSELYRAGDRWGRFLACVERMGDWG